MGKRTVSVEMGLMSHDELVAENAHKSLDEVVVERSFKLCGQPITTEAIRERTRGFLDNAHIKVTYDDVMMLVTLFVLFGDDVRLASYDFPTDENFVILTSVCFFMFLVELVLNVFAKSEVSWNPDPNAKAKDKIIVEGYVFSFFFWLDIVSLATVAFDVPWMKFRLSGDAKSSSDAGRVVRMIRLVRLVKLYKIASQRRREAHLRTNLLALVDAGRMTHDEMERYNRRLEHQKQSKVGAELVDMITRKVILCVLVMLIIVPLLTLDEEPNHMAKSTEFFNRQLTMYPSCEDGYLGLDGLLDAKGTVNLNFPPILWMKIDSPPGEALECNYDAHAKAQVRLPSFQEDEMRPEFINYVCAVDNSTSLTHNVCVVFDVSKDSRGAAELSIILTCFVTVVLISMSIAFESDAQLLVLSPIESMMAMIRTVAEDPLEEFTFESTKGAGEYETKVVQLAIQKITTLLRIGFGVAGADIISKSMSVEAGKTANLDPMLPGKRMYSIFGFCDIHEFDMCTGVLEDQIMKFVNSVATIVHEEVTTWGGACNKNLGNAFLMVWRIGDEQDLKDSSGSKKPIVKAPSDRGVIKGPPRPGGSPKEKEAPVVNLRRVPGLENLSDKALVGFLKVVVGINREKTILGYRDDERLNHEGGNYKLRMGFGLHAGWAIEGAVGSLQKVDATYLSPHVNMAARMEAASRQFGVSVLMTEDFHELMSDRAQELCRRLDVVTVKGSAVPMPIYTYDCFQDQEFAVLSVPKGMDLKLEKILQRKADNYNRETWDEDFDLVQLRKHCTKRFEECFKAGIDSYLGGSWGKAKELLEKADSIMAAADESLAKTGDGPSRTILRYMANRNGICPPEWQGFRPLTSK